MHRRGSNHSSPPGVSGNGAKGDEDTQGETMSETIGTMTSREACRVGARWMRHGGTGKQTVSYETSKKNAPHEMIATSADGTSRQ